jgi:parvulin-like peptidyl-prolyl isomerase
MHRKLFAALIIISFVVVFGGCGKTRHLPATLKPQAFQPTVQKTSDAPRNTSPQANSQAANSTAKNQTAAALDPLDPQNFSAPTTGPATRPAIGASSGSFMYVGTVVAEVSGQPIFADKVLAKTDPELSVKMPLLEPREFRRAAESAIRRQIEYDINLEREFAAAQRNTTAEEQQRAKMLATAWRQREIIKAGGSLAVARRQSLDRDGIDFEDRVNEQYQNYVILIYRNIRLEPLVQITGDDLRRFYDQNIEKFTEKAGVRFRAIKIGVKEMGNREAALREIEPILERAKRGEDFAKLAVEKNHDPLRLKNHGWWEMVPVKDDQGQKIGDEPAWIEPNSLRLEQIEKAAFALEPGEITPVPVDTGDAFWIVKLEQKQKGRVRAFEEPEVQGTIRRALFGEQLMALRLKEYQRLEKGSVVRRDERMIQTTVDMAMQKYHAWARANPLTRAVDSPAAPASR